MSDLLLISFSRTEGNCSDDLVVLDDEKEDLPPPSTPAGKRKRIDEIKSETGVNKVISSMERFHEMIFSEHAKQGNKQPASDHDDNYVSAIMQAFKVVDDEDKLDCHIAVLQTIKNFDRKHKRYNLQQL